MHNSAYKVAILLMLVSSVLILSFDSASTSYSAFYKKNIASYRQHLKQLIATVESGEDPTITEAQLLQEQISIMRLKMKAIDFWLRYLEPVAYKKINGPLPVEWETEVFEKYEKPYKREGAGLTLAQLELDADLPQKKILLQLLNESDAATGVFQSDSIVALLMTPDHFFFANRLFLLNLASIYTTGFECPDRERIIPELESMLADVEEIYSAFGNSYPEKTLSGGYLQLYEGMKEFVHAQNHDPLLFDHFHFIRDYVNPLYALNQQFIRDYHVVSRSYNDYSLNNSNTSLFNKDLFKAQNRKGIFIAVDDPEKLEAISAIGKLLFFDPVLSGNGKRSCASCHKPSEYFTDTTVATSLQFDHVTRLARNTPSLVNAVYNHLLMQDGMHFTLLRQGKEVMINKKEMGSDPEKILSNVMSCRTYKKAFQQFTKLTPNYPDVTLDHVASALSIYYSGFSDFTAPFDRAMNGQENISAESEQGFNLFMSKAGCGTCHFVPQFNGVKPPFIGSEFEVLGVPSDTFFTAMSNDSGRFIVNPAAEMMQAFRTGSIRNAGFTSPYMHNGVFKTMKEVIDFYNNGGGDGKGLVVVNQTLSKDSLHLTAAEKNALLAFIKTLQEEITIPTAPLALPATNLITYQHRKVGGEY
ncbi:MAG TPA: cytochrome c peroxidase [Chitinophagales bacterium]|nr:cytochrome c peroxidase [Chitinophagales bacterium]